MYKLSVPIMSATVNHRNRETYVRLCRDAKAERIFFGQRIHYGSDSRFPW